MFYFDFECRINFVTTILFYIQIFQKAIKMPIFSKKFEIKHIPPRAKRYINCPQIQEKINDFQIVQLNLNKKKLKFVNGTWSLSQQSSHDTDINIDINKKKLQKLEEENNLKQVKIDVLLDMLTENLTELNIIRGK